MRVSALLGLLLSGVFALTGAVRAAEDIKTVEATPNEDYVSAATIDFDAAFEVGSASLSAMGSRIEQARRGADPVALAGAAVEVGAMEQATGKCACLTAEALMKEAIDLAKLRSCSVELKAICAMVSCEETKKGLAEDIARAEAGEADAQAALESGERSRGVCHLHVDNHTCGEICVHYNGREVGDVWGHNCAEFPMHTSDHAFTIEIYGGGRYWRYHYHGDYHELNITVH